MMNRENGKEVAKRNFGKTDIRYWNSAVFKPAYRRDGEKRSIESWAARIQWRGRRELFSLRTSNRSAAAAKARDIYATLAGGGWAPALERFKPEMVRHPVLTVGDFLSELRGHWSGKPKTFEDYCRSFRTIVSQIFRIEGGREKFDHVTGGRSAWVAKIDRIKLADVTPDKVNRWRIGFVKRAGANPLKQRRARITCNSMMRQAKSLFASKLLAHVAIDKPDILPFDGVSFYKRENMHYHSTVDIEAMISDAAQELPQEPFKVFLLATMAGLRRGEIDKLQWTAFNWQDRTIRIETTEHLTPKSADSVGDVFIDEELTALFLGWHAKAASPFVIDSDAESAANATYTNYRSEAHFRAVIEWLRAKGVTAVKPLHELRKEFGSQLCAKYGIYAASRMLRHADIAITAQHYVDQKERVTFGMGNLLVMPNNVTPISAAPDTNVLVTGIVTARAAVSQRAVSKKAVRSGRK